MERMTLFIGMNCACANNRGNINVIGSLSEPLDYSYSFRIGVIYASYLILRYSVLRADRLADNKKDS